MQILILFAILMSSASALSSQLKLAAAADLKFAMDEIIQSYQATNTHEKVIAIYGASGKFQMQIQEGAPFDLFFSADSEKALPLEHAGLVSGQPFHYARGHLVLWVPNSSKIKLDSRMKCLAAPTIKKLAVANPLTAPYGKAAQEALKRADMFQDVRTKLVIGENIAQAAQFVESGAAEIGILAKSLALSPTLKSEGRFADIDPTLYTELQPTGVVLKRGNVVLAQKFRDFVLSPTGRSILARYGFSL